MKLVVLSNSVNKIDAGVGVKKGLAILNIQIAQRASAQDRYGEHVAVRDDSEQPRYDA
jgi:hypothetical protein